MKHPILIIGTFLLFIGLTAFAYINRNHTAISNPIISPNWQKITSGKAADFDFVYSVDTRFQSTITKEKLERAESIVEILQQERQQAVESQLGFALTSFYDKPQKKGPIQSYHNVAIHTFHGMRKGEVQAQGEDENLNEDQIQLLQAMDYASDFYISGNVQRKTLSGDGLVPDTLIQYMSVVPDQPAVYKAGNAKLLTYLKEQSAATIANARKARIQPGKISFTVTKAGEIGSIRLDYTSGYAPIDEKMLELIRNLPGAWEPAANATGEKVEQELVFFFGVMGC